MEENISMEWKKIASMEHEKIVVHSIHTMSWLGERFLALIKQ